MIDKIRTALMTAYCLIVFAGMVIFGAVLGGRGVD